jgi:hypothetical protein
LPTSECPEIYPASTRIPESVRRVTLLDAIFFRNLQVTVDTTVALP